MLSAVISSTLSYSSDATGVTTGTPEVCPPGPLVPGAAPSNLQRPRQIGTKLSHDVLNPAHVPLKWRTAYPWDRLQPRMR